MNRIPAVRRARLTFTALLVVALGGADSARADDDARVLDRVVALVERQVITLSELELEARIALVQRGGLQAASGPLDAKALTSALDLAIGTRLQELEAEKLQAVPVSAKEVEEAIASFRARFPGAAAFQQFLDQHEADLSQLGSVLARTLRAEKMLDTKLRLRAQVSEEEVRRYYQRHANDLSGEYEQLRPALREKLFRERYAALASSLLREMRQGASVRLVAPLSDRSDGGPR